MTPVEFTFVAPNGRPVVNAVVEIQLLRAGYDVVETGIIMPRPVAVDTDEFGKVTVNLQPSNIAYVVSVYDTESEAGLSYKFYVPQLTPPATKVRFQDIVVDTEMSGKPYDEEALQLILAIKANISAAWESTEENSNIALAKAGEAAVSASSSEDSATRSAASAAASAGSASASASSASDAAASASNAGTANQSAIGYASNAQTSAGAAENSATNSAASATASDTAKGLSVAARIAAEAARDVATGARDTAVQSATNAGTSETNALASKNAAKTSELLAADWAGKLGSPVAGGVYSAQYYAQIAASAAATVSTGQQQSDWNETNIASKSYIVNKPVLANVSLTGKYSDLLNKPVYATVAATGSYNDLTDKPTIPGVPTKVSQLTNDTNFITLSQSRAGLTATGALTYDAATGTFFLPEVATVAITGNYNDLTGLPTIPTAVGALTNDVGYLTTSTVPVRSVAGKTGFVTLIKGDVGLANVDNTSDAAKPISTAVQAALDTKQNITGAVNLALIHASRFYF